MATYPIRQPHRPERRTLEDLAVAAVAVGGVDHAAVAWLSGGTVATIGSTDLTADALTEEQVGSGRGPLIEAIVGRCAVSVPDIPDAWAHTSLGRLAAAHGVAALAAHPVLTDGHLVGVLALYRVRPGVPGPEVADVAAAAGWALRAPEGGIGGRSTVDLAAEAIGRARGISSLRALVLLRQQARTEGRSLADVAAGVLSRRPTRGHLRG